MPCFFKFCTSRTALVHRVWVCCAVFCAKVVADRFNRGIFEAYLDLACVPFLPEPMTSASVSSVTNQLTAADVMATGVTALPPVVAITELLHVLQSTSFQVHPSLDQTCLCSSIIAIATTQGIVMRKRLR